MKKINRFEGRHALVTGGSSGIGFEIARLLAKEGARLILVGRNGTKLEKASEALKKEHAMPPRVISKDIAKPSGARELFEQLRSENLPVDILVNNAGFGVYGLFHEVDAEKTLGMIDLHAASLTLLTRLFLPGMIERKFGRILNVASTAGFQPVPIEAVYAASKAYVIHFSEAIAQELKGTGVTVTCLCPGPTDTPFFSEDKDIPASRRMRRFMMTASTVAAVGIQALKSGRPLAVPGLPNKIALFSLRIAPRKIVPTLARKMVE